MILRVILLSFWSTACLLPLLWKVKLNVVTEVYLRAALDFWRGVSPYYHPSAGDVFQYPPVFAMFYYPLTWLPPFGHAVMWCLINCFFFWWGMMSLLEVISGSRKMKWLAVIFAAVELDISLRYQQVNAMVVGMMLLAAVAQYQGRSSRAAAFLATATAIKIFPIAVAGFFSLSANRKYLKALCVSGAVLLALPVIRFGFSGTVSLYHDLYTFLGSDLYSRQMYELRSNLERMGFDELGRVGDTIVTAISVAFLGIEALWFRRETRVWLWLSVFLSAFVLLNPRTESPAFVIMAPCYLMLLPQAKRFGKAWLVGAFFLSTFVYTSLWPQRFFPALTHLWASKSFGVLMVWLYATVLLAKSQWGAKAILHREPLTA